MSWGGWGEGQKKARGALMRGTPFASSHRPPRVGYFWIITIFIGILSESRCGGERVGIGFVCFRVVVFRKYSSEIFSWKFVDVTMKRILNNCFRI